MASNSTSVIFRVHHRQPSERLCDQCGFPCGLGGGDSLQDDGCAGKSHRVGRRQRDLQRAVAGLNGQLSQRRTLTVHEACPQRSGYIGATWWRSP